MAEQNESPQPAQPEKKGGYGKRPLWQWVVFYLIIAVIVYFAIYYFFFTGHAGGGSTTNTLPGY